MDCTSRVGWRSKWEYLFPCNACKIEVIQPIWLLKRTKIYDILQNFPRIFNFCHNFSNFMVQFFTPNDNHAPKSPHIVHVSAWPKAEYWRALHDWIGPPRRPNERALWARRWASTPNQTLTMMTMTTSYLWLLRRRRRLEALGCLPRHLMEVDLRCTEGVISDRLRTRTMSSTMCVVWILRLVSDHLSQTGWITSPNLSGPECIKGVWWFR